jgi:hypothetical protein
MNIDCIAFGYFGLTLYVISIGTNYCIGGSEEQTAQIAELLASSGNAAFQPLNIDPSQMTGSGDDSDSGAEALALRLRREYLQACPTARVSVIASCCRLPNRRAHAKSIAAAASAMAGLLSAQGRAGLEPLSWSAAYSDVF